MDNLSDLSVRYLRDLIRIDTTNPPGNELAAAQYIANALSNEGISPVVLESASGRGNVVARLQGDGSAAPLLLMSHLDVVPADPSQWAHPPFSADLVDGYIWGRGAVDTKQLTAMQMAILVHLKQDEIPLRRDVILAATADEEVGGEHGMGWLARNHPDLIRSEYAINEGGGFGLTLGGQRIYVCQTGQKGVCWLRLTARGTPGHASMPHRDNAVAKLSAALGRLANAHLPQHLTPTVVEMVRRIARTQSFPLSVLLPLVLNPLIERPLLERVGGDGALSRALPAMLHNTATPTVLRAGQKTNVIPTSASAEVDCRILPGQTSDSLLKEIQPYLGKDVTTEVIVYAAPLETEPSSPLFDLFSAVLQRHEPGAVLIPYMLPGGTDGPFVAALGAKVYGFCPTRSEPDWSFMELAHGNDERISVANMAFGSTVLNDIVREFCAAA